MKHLPSLFVIVLAGSAALLGFLWMKERDTRKELMAQNQELLVDMARQTAFLQDQTNDLYRDILWRIEDEVVKEEKTVNLGLIDTIGLIHKGAQELLALDSPVPEEVSQWSAFLRSVYTQIIPPNWEEPLPDFSAPRPLTSEQQRLQLLEWEYETLAIIDMRVGASTCFCVSKSTLMLSHIHKTSLVEGDSFEAELFVVDDNDDWVERREPTTLFETSIGTVTLGPSGRPTLTILTEGLLKPNEHKKLISYNVTALASSPYCEYDTLRYNGAFWVVRD